MQCGEGNNKFSPAMQIRQPQVSSMQKLSEQITVRLTADLRSAIQEIESRHRIGAGEFVRGLVEAGVTMYRTHGFFSFPIEVIPDRRSAKPPAGRK
jgi:hypothetical protein